MPKVTKKQAPIMDVTGENPIIVALEATASTKEELAKKQEAMQDAIKTALAHESTHVLIVNAFARYHETPDDAAKLRKKARHGALRMALRRITMNDKTGEYTTCTVDDSGKYVIRSAFKAGDKPLHERIAKCVSALMSEAEHLDADGVKELQELVSGKFDAMIADKAGESQPVAQAA